MTAETFERHVTRHAIDLARSPRWQVGPELSGFALLAFRERRAWVGGFGVVPQQRRHGLALRYLQDVFTICQVAGVRTLELEVLAHNAPAVALYERGGFDIIDELVAWSRKPTAVNVTRDSDWVADEDEHAVSSIARQPSTCWQREPSSVTATTPRERVIVGRATDPAAYAFLWRAASRPALLDAGARNAASAKSLLDILERTATNAPLILINEPAHGPLHDAFTAHQSWAETARQYRMRASFI